VSGCSSRVHLLQLRSRAGHETLWAYRYRVRGRGSKRVQRGGFASEEDARAALERALEKLREHGVARTLTFAELVDDYLAQHEARRDTREASLAIAGLLSSLGELLQCPELLAGHDQVAPGE
jgi:hypothetical protein